MNIITKLTIILFVLVLSAVCYADVKLPAVIGDGMVLQQKALVNVWGWADPGEKVDVKASWQWVFGKSVRAGKDGKWKISIKTPKAGGPHRITIKGKNTIKLDNVLTGEVWIGSGQSNMEMPLLPVSKAYTGIMDFEDEIENARYPEIRLFQVGNFSSKEPVDDVQPGNEIYGVPPAECKWQECSPESIPTFSSTAYFFARKLHEELGVPVGIIDSSWGGTNAESWTPAEGLGKLGYKKELKQAKESAQQADKKIPTRLYNGMIHPLRNFTIKGVIWYQGEGNVGRAYQYRALFPAMIKNWRSDWKQEDFPFYYVQIAPFNYNRDDNKPPRYSEELREAQRVTLETKNTGMAVTMDIGDVKDIHPRNKRDVGKRLALWALAKNYGKKKLVYSGPLYRSKMRQGDKIRLYFDHIGSGLTTRDGKELTHFTIASHDKKFVEAKAVIDGKNVVVSSEDVKNPVAVRYGWSNTAEPNLSNKEGLPASSFRTDNWPGKTYDER